MKLVVSAPFPVGALLWQPEAGAWRLTLHAKATYALIHGGESSLCVEQPPIGPQDRAPAKPKAEVLVVGHAHGAPGESVRGVLARLRIGDLERATRIDRDDGAIPELGPQSFDSSVHPTDEARARSWVREFASDRERVEAPAPESFDYQHFNLAPVEQRRPSLQLQSAIVLEHLHPTDQLLATRLRPIRPRAKRVPAPSASAQEIELVADTLWIDADSGRASVIWRGSLDLGASPDGVGELVVTMESGRASDPDAQPTATIAIGGAHPLGRRHDALKNRSGSDARAASESTPDDEPTPRDPAPVPPRALPPLQPSGDTVQMSTVDDDGDGDDGPATQVRRATDGAREVGADDLDDTTASEVDEPSTFGDEETDEPQLVDVVRSAEIHARLCACPEDRSTILEQERVSEAQWTAAREQSSARIAEACAKGDSKLRDRYDHAFLTGLERHRVPVSEEVAARIIVATERGELGSLTAELSLQLDDLLVLGRALQRRATDDEAAGRAMAREVARLRASA